MYNVSFMWWGVEHNYDCVSADTVAMFASIIGVWITVETVRD